MPELTEAEAIAYLATLQAVEDDGERVPLTVGPWTAFIMVSVMQLATRHPDMSAAQKTLIGGVIDQLRPLFAGTPGWQLLQLGDDPAYDIPHACRYPDGPHDPACPPGGHAGFRVAPLTPH